VLRLSALFEINYTYKKKKTKKKELLKMWRLY